ncbi:MAG: dicarboxylate/amino acid:cation symporter [Bifidobacteriaceae bacterium]|jgi:Na+/H+-dicarboxylate symporter|nr:dicarboxylate/amino acid:cation symporter [Bifidobacteriaceae bacterium]
MSGITLDWVSLGVTLVLFAVLAFLSIRKIVGFGLRTIIATVFGIVVGAAFQGHTTYVAAFGSVWSNAISAIVVPLLLFSIIASITNLGESVRLKNIGLKSIIFLLLNTLTAALLALGFGLAFGVGKGFNYTPVAGYKAHDVPGVLDTLVNLFPSNLMANWSQNQVVPVVIFAILVAIAFNSAAKTPKGSEAVAPFKRFVDAGNVVLSKATQIVIGFTPYAVLALIANAVSGSDIATLVPLLGVLVVAYIAIIIQMFIIQPLLLSGFTRLNPFRFFKAFWPAGVVAFTSESSIGTIPVTVRQLKQMGVKGDIASFVSSLGANLGMPGCAGIWPVLVAVFTINAQGLNYSAGQFLFLVVLALLVSIGTVGVPGTATVTATSLFAAAGLPVEFIAVMQPISTIVDMGRTALNVAGAANSAVIVAKTEDQLDLDVYNGKKEYVEEDEELLAEAAALVGGGRNASKQGATSDPAAVPVADPAPSAAAPAFNLDTAAGALNFSPASALAGQDDDMCGIGNGGGAETASDSRQA